MNVTNLRKFVLSPRCNILLLPVGSVRASRTRVDAEQHLEISDQSSPKPYSGTSVQLQALLLGQHHRTIGSYDIGSTLTEIGQHHAQQHSV